MIDDEVVGEKSVKMRGRLLSGVVLVLVLLGIGAGGTIYVIRQKPEILGLSKGAADAQAEVDKLIAEVGKLIALPADERPTVATITDIEKLTEQPFFKNGANGDKVLVYTNARKAILYRPTEKRIIDVGALNINNQGQTAGTATSAPVKIALYNGTSTSGLTNVLEKTIKEKISNAEVVAKRNAAKRDYTWTVIVDLSGNRSADAQALANLLGGKIASLPAGEKTVEADILVIAGADQLKK